MAWAQVLAGWLMPKENRRDPQFAGYLRNGLAANKPWDRFAREMLVARPEGTGERGAVLFLGHRKAALKDHSIARDVGRATLLEEFSSILEDDIEAWCDRRGRGAAVRKLECPACRDIPDSDGEFCLVGGRELCCPSRQAGRDREGGQRRK